MGAEKITETAIRKNLTGLGFKTYKIHVGQYGPEGFPDLIVVKDGITSYFEVKASGESPTAIQRLRMKELRMAGCVAGPVWSLNDVMWYLKRREYYERH